MINKITIQLRPNEKDNHISIVKGDGIFGVDELSRRMIIQKLHLQTDYFDSWPADRTFEIFGSFELMAVHYRKEWNLHIQKDIWVPCTKRDYHHQMNIGLPGTAKKMIMIDDYSFVATPEPGEDRSYYFKAN